MDDALRERVEALERAVTDGDHDLSAVADEAAALDRLDNLESRVAAAEDRLDDLDAASQALRGYVGNVRAVNTDVEQRADAALAKAESLERRLDRDGPTDTSSTVASTDTESDGHSRPRQSSAGDGRRERAAQPSRAEPATGGSEQEHPTDGGSQHDRCASCGRPHERVETGTEPTGEARHDTGTPGRREPARAATPEQRQSMTGTERQVTGHDSQAGHQTHASGNPATAAHGTEGTHAADPAETDVPTVASLAQADASQTEQEETGPDPLPDGTADPLVGATDETAEAGTLERIRDLL